MPTPQIAVFGETFVVHFDSAGLPQPEIEWEYPSTSQLEGRVHTLEAGHLKVTDVQMADSGLYSVTITNKFGTATADLEVEVHGR